jgi:hypothetical protein
LSIPSLPSPLGIVLSFGLWSRYFAVNVVIHRAHKLIQGDDCQPRWRSWLRFPWLSPIQNSFKLRGLYRCSYFGPRTCGGGINLVAFKNCQADQGSQSC